MANSNKGDDRIVVRTNDPAQRGDARVVADFEREEEDGLMTREERIQMIRNEWAQTALPRPPDVPGKHWFWGSTTSTTDTIHRRLKLGYKLVKKTELPDFIVEKQNSADYAEYITCNEMILMWIPTELFQDIMGIFHHEMPLDEERSIRDRVETQRDELNRKAGKEAITVEGEGLRSLGQVRKPKFDN